MASPETLRRLALSLPESSEEPHFEKTSFRVAKKIFASYDSASNQACLKLTPAGQDVFSTFGQGVVQAVPNKWGAQGWTLVALAPVTDALLEAMLQMAWRRAAPKKLAAVLPEENPNP